MIDTKGKTILVNELGLKRINESRKAKKQKELDNVQAVSVGDEVVADMLQTVGSTESGTMSTYAESTQTLIEASLPNSVDNSQRQSFPPIRSQGGLGSCVSFSATYYQMTHMAGLAMGWDTKDDNDDTNKFSPKWTYNFINQGKNQGTNIAEVCKLLEKHGAAFWSDFPYDGAVIEKNYREWPRDASIWKKAMNYRLDKMGYVYIENGTDTPVTGPQSKSIKEVKQLLNNGYVLNYSTFIHSWKYREITEGPFAGEKAAYMMAGTDGSHGMTLVGYNDDMWVDVDGDGQKDTGEMGAFKIANSWGKGWINNGFSWVAYDALNKKSFVDPMSAELNPSDRYGIFGREMVWFTIRKNYSPKLIAEFKISHPKRDELALFLGYSSYNDSASAVTWESFAINYAAGPYAFDGSLTECEGTFALDFTDLYSISDNKDGKWYLKVKDKSFSPNGYSGKLNEFKLIDNQKGQEIYYTGQYPSSFDASEAEVGIYNSKDIFGFTGWKMLKGLSRIKYNAASIGLDNMVYVIGGSIRVKEGSTEYEAGLDEVQAYDTYSNEWINKSKLPEPLKQPQAVTANEKIYAADLSSSWSSPNTLYEYDPSTRQWTVNHTDLPVKKKSVMVSMNNKIYFVGGDHQYCDIQEYNPLTKELRKLDTIIPYPVKNFAVVALDGKIYVIGGDSVDGSQIRVNRVQEYNLAENRWTEKAGLLQGRNKFKAQVVNGKIYTFGSESIYGNLGKDSYIGTIEEYSPSSNLWQDKGKMFFNLKEYGLAVLDNKMYLASGREDIGSKVTSAFAVYNPAPIINSVPGRVEAEAFNYSSNYCFVGDCSEGGQNINWLLGGDSMEYYINSMEAGIYTARFRVSSDFALGKLKLTKGSDTLCIVEVPDTGGDQNWVTVSANISLGVGPQIINVECLDGSWNFNWMEFELVEKVVALPGRVEAEDYKACYEVCFVEDCIEGGQNLKWIISGDWMDYKVYVPESGIYTVNFRVARPGTMLGGLRLKRGDTVLCTVDIPDTGGAQNWITVSAKVQLTGGFQDLRVESTVTDWSFNYMEFIK